MSEDRLLKAVELAARLGFAPGTVLDMWERGDLPGYKLPNGAVRFRASEVDAWLEECRRGPVRSEPARVST